MLVHLTVVTINLRNQLKKYYQDKDAYSYLRLIYMDEFYLVIDGGTIVQVIGLLTIITFVV